MNSGEELYNKVYESPRSPQRIVLKPTLHDGRQDTTSIEERESIQRPFQQVHGGLQVNSTIGIKGWPILQFNMKITHARKQAKS